MGGDRGKGGDHFAMGQAKLTSHIFLQPLPVILRI